MDNDERLQEIWADLQELDDEQLGQVEALVKMLLAVQMTRGEWRDFQVTYWN